MAADFFFLNIEEMSDVYNHLLMGESQLIISRAVRRRGGDDVGGAVNTVGRGRRVGRDEDGGRGAGHRWDGWAVVWCVKGKKGVWMVDAKGTIDWWRCCKVLESQGEVEMRIV